MIGLFTKWGWFWELVVYLAILGLARLFAG
jgi:hypothetical protein